MKLRNLHESKVVITDNEITYLKHHVKDAEESIASGDTAVLKSSLGDLKELVAKLENRLSPSERSEI